MPNLANPCALVSDESLKLTTAHNRPQALVVLKDDGNHPSEQEIMDASSKAWKWREKSLAEGKPLLPPIESANS